jgi:hypothetical protein
MKYRFLKVMILVVEEFVLLEHVTIVSIFYVH